MVNDGCLNDRPCVKLLLHRAPLALKPGAPNGEDNVPIFRFWLHDVDEHGVADVQGWALFAVSAMKFAA